MNRTWQPARKVDIHVERWVRGRTEPDAILRRGRPFEGYVSKVEHGTRGRLIVTVSAEGQSESIKVRHTRLRVRR